MIETLSLRCPLARFSTCESPLTCLSRKIEELATQFFGFFVRVCVFELGEYNKGFLQKQIIELFKRMDGGRADAVFDAARLDRGIARLEGLGGQRRTIPTADGLASLDCMLLTHDNFKRSIADKGGEWLSLRAKAAGENAFDEEASPDALHVEFLVKKPGAEKKEWDHFCENTLLKFGWKKGSIVLADGTKKEGILVDYRPAGAVLKKECFLRCHSVGQAYAMDLKYIGQHIGLGKDVCLFDYRGTHRSTGDASEGGYYLDAEAVYNSLIDKDHYRPDQIWATGFCLGATVAAHLKEKFGVNYVGENTFLSMPAFIKNQNPIAPILGKWGTPALQSKEDAICKRVAQDLFDTERRLSEGGNKAAKAIIISTTTDQKIHKEDGAKLFAAAKKSADAYHLICTPSTPGDGHSVHPLHDPLTWRRYVEILTT